ncbi:MAG: hypothetical protein HY050_05560 [Actinobacteria bacterium]|nr:hypothetical protein [Actinomycetota bacterium]
MTTPEAHSINSKPEWFQLTEADQIQARPKVNRAARILALASPLLVVGMGVIVAQNGNAPTAIASAVQASAPMQNSTAVTPKISASPQSTATSQPVVAPVSLTTGVRPSISIPPSGDGDADGD